MTALEDEASTSSFVPDYLVAGADDMNFINKENAAAEGGSAAGSLVDGGGRVHFSNSSQNPVSSDAATSESRSTELSETEKEIAIQFSSCPGAQELIPTPPSFVYSNASLPPEEGEEDLLPPQSVSTNK